MKKDLIKKLRELDVVYKGSVELKHAGGSNFYINIKKAYGYPETLDLICKCLWEKIDKKTTCIAASGYGGVPPATILAERYNLKLTLIRENEKNHGKAGLIEGYIPNEKDKVSIIDDVFTTGGSLRKIIEVVKLSEAEILGCYVVVRRGKEKLESSLHNILTAKDLL